MIDRTALIAVARRFHGVRFAHQGRTEHGLDCLGLLLVTAQTAGLKFETRDVGAIDVPTYGARPDVKLLQHKLERFLISIAHHELLAGDVLLLNVAQSPQHLALLTDYPASGELGMIHAYAPARKVVEHRYDQGWQRATASCYCLPHFHEFPQPSLQHQE